MGYGLNNIHKSLAVMMGLADGPSSADAGWAPRQFHYSWW
jgi:hypothetical protein